LSFDEKSAGVVLPSLQYRLRLLQAVMVAADSIQAQRTTDVVLPQKSLSKQASASASSLFTSTASTSSICYQQRLYRLLQEELVPSAARALLLFSNNDNNGDELVMVLAQAATLEDDDDDEDADTQWVACIALLLSNLLLNDNGNINEDGGYDSRVRHVLKTACVHVLSQEMLKRYETDESWTMYIDEFDESMGAIFTGTVRPTAPSRQQSILSINHQEQVTPLEQLQEQEEEANGAIDQKLEISMESSNDVCLGSSEDTTLQPLSTEEESAQEKEEQAVTTLCIATETSLAMTNVVTTVDLVSTNDPVKSHVMFIATRKFEAIEREIATDIFRSLASLREQGKDNDKGVSTDEERRKATRRSVIRGLQIGTVGVVAGTLFAVTGGLAAPALAAGIASIGAAASSTTVVTVALLTTAKAAAAVFGFGGGGLAAYKMKKRTQGLQEFRLRRENIDQNMYETASVDCLRRVIRNSLPQLHTTICVSGWLREKYKGADFQAAWGVQPTDPLIESKWELLKRFYAVHDPEKVKTCEAEMKERKKKERKSFSWDAVWNELQKEYGCSPEHVLPTNVPNDAVTSMSLSSQEQAAISCILVKAVLKTTQGDSCAWTPPPSPPPSPTKPTKDDSAARHLSVPEEKLSHVDDSDKQSTADTSCGSSDSDDNDSANNTEEDSKQQSKEEKEEELVVWDWQAIYGSDLHTITWETDTLQNMCHIANSMTRQVTSQATRLALQHAMFVGAVLSAVALPSSLLTATQVIDDPYQIVILRADEAGKELASCLLQSDERRPVTLVGYSFGARVIFSCLVELARLQDLWEGVRQQQERSADDQSMLDPSVSTGKNQSDDVVGQQREPASIVEDVVFMGLPRVIDQRMLRLARQVVGGRFVNCYTRNDWLLTLMFLTRRGTQTCGTHPIQNIGGIENYNVTSLVQAHSKYAEAVPRILQHVGLGKPLALPHY
jgi:hypothetical protein